MPHDLQPHDLQPPRPSHLTVADPARRADAEALLREHAVRGNVRELRATALIVITAHDPSPAALAAFAAAGLPLGPNGTRRALGVRE